MANRYSVILESKDEHLYQYNCIAEDEQTAIKQAMNKIKKKGWDKYMYKVIYADICKDSEISEYINTTTILDMIGMNDEATE